MADFVDALLHKEVTNNVSYDLYDAPNGTIIKTVAPGHDLGYVASFESYHNWFSPNDIWLNIQIPPGGGLFPNDVTPDGDFHFYVKLSGSGSGLSVGGTPLHISDNDKAVLSAEQNQNPVDNAGQALEGLGSKLNPFPSIVDFLKKAGKFAEYGAFAVGGVIVFWVLFKIYKFLKKGKKT